MAITYEQAIQALKAADAAGNVEDARKIAQIASKLKASNNVPHGTPETDPNWAANEMSAGGRFAAGAGKAIVDLGRGAGQMTGLVSGDDVQASRERDAALMDTGAGTAGNIAGSIAAFVPTMAIPGANTYTGAAALGGVFGALQPTTEDESRLKNTAVGGALGVAGQYGANKLAQVLKGKTLESTAKQSKNALKDAVLKNSQEAGYVVPKSEVSPTFLSNRAEGLAGKAALKQDMTLTNQQVSNSLARKVIGLADDQPITTDAIKSYQNTVSQPYREVASLSKKAASNLEKLKQVRNDAQAQWNFYNRSADPSALKIAKQLDGEAAALESQIESIASSKGSPDLLTRLREARKLLAQSYDVKRALNPVSGDIDTKVLARMLDKGKPLSDELKTIAEFGKTYPKFSGKGDMTPAPGVSKVEGMMMALLSGGGAAALGPAGLAAGALPLASPVVRKAMLTKAFQQSMVKPNYDVNMLVKALTGNKAQMLLKSAPAIGVTQ